MMLEVNPRDRPSAEDLLELSFFKSRAPLPCDPHELFSHVPHNRLPDQLNEHHMRSRVH